MAVAVEITISLKNATNRLLRQLSPGLARVPGSIEDINIERAQALGS
jgi:hypothetical protein